MRSTLRGLAPAGERIGVEVAHRNPPTGGPGGMARQIKPQPVEIAVRPGGALPPRPTVPYLRGCLGGCLGGCLVGGPAPNRRAAIGAPVTTRNTLVR